MASFCLSDNTFAHLENEHTGAIMLTTAIRAYPRPNSPLAAQVYQARPNRLRQLSTSKPCVTSTKPSIERNRPMAVAFIPRSLLTHTIKRHASNLVETCCRLKATRMSPASIRCRCFGHQTIAVRDRLAPKEELFCVIESCARPVQSTSSVVITRAQRAARNHSVGV